MTGPLSPNNLRVFDIPDAKAQFHLHGDAACGKLITHDRQHEVILNAYESAMVDLLAPQVGLKPLDRIIN